jgi:transposase InsO family protein
MEQRRKDIEGLQRTHGYTEEEAEVAYLLKVAHARLAALYKRKFEEEQPGRLAGQRAGMSRMASVAA